jgi:putative membrane-bound dehydrogenase-like protein
MKKVLIICAFLLAAVCGQSQESKPLRIFIRSGPKTHGPGQHDSPRFLKDWTKLLNERGAKASGKEGFPSAEELENTDVLVMYLAEGGTIAPEDRVNLDKFLKRGGGIVTLHDGVCGTDPQWFKTVIGGAWEHGKSKFYEGLVGVYFIDTEHPITKGVSNFDLHDEVYWDLDMMPEAHILANSFQSVFVIAPQMWTYEKDNYRSFVWLQGHETESFSLPHFRALLLRGIAWAGKRDVDMLCTKEELGSLKYPEGGPTAPEKAAAKLNVHPEFDISLVASEPLIQKAISLDWDPQGRLWVAETPEYPNGRTINKNDEPISLWGEENPEAYKTEKKVDRPAKDRISWLEDTDGDGRMDKKHVFANGLELVTSLVFYKDGVIVTQAPQILWLRDIDGDGVCNMKNERVVLFNGWGTMDAHAVINNLRWGMDGWVYGAVGYSAGYPVSGDGSKKFGHITAGIYRFQPDGSALEQVASGSCNTWGFDFSPDGEAFYSTATCGEHLLHIVMPEKILQKGNIGGVRASAVLPDHQKTFPAIKHTRPAYVQIDWVGGFTAAAGSCIYNGGAWPEKFEGSHFLSEPTVNIVHNEFLKPKGVTFVASKEAGREETEFIAGRDLWFRPVHTRVGPDGALYVVDFYNQAAIHNDTRGPKHGANNAAVRPDRDHHLGRIWRVQHKEAKQLPPAAFKTTEELVRDLDHPNGWVRTTAERLLMEHGDQSALPAIEKIASSESSSNYGRIQALWTSYLVSRKHNPELLTKLYEAKDENVRKAVMQLIRNYPIPESEYGDYEKLFSDMRAEMTHPEGRLRLETLMAISSAEKTDKFADALWDAYPTLSDPWTESALVSIFVRDPEGAILQATALSDPSIAKRTVGELAKRMANQQDTAAASRLLTALASKPASADALKQVVLEAFNRGLKENAVWTPALKEAFGSFLKSSDSVAIAALPLVARWDQKGELTPELKPVIQPLLAKLSDANEGVEQRAEIAAALLGLRKLDDGIVPALIAVIKGDNSPVLQRRIIEDLGTVSDQEIATRLIEAYPTINYRLRDPIFAQLAKRPEWAAFLIDAIQKQTVPLNDLGPALIHRLRTHPDAAIAKRAGEVIDAIRGPEIKEKDALIAQFSAAVREKGDIEKGHQLFTQNCVTCHKFKGEGRDLAPDLTGMGAHGPADLLVHIVDPNRVVEPNFITASIETKDDLSYDGIIARENQKSLVLRNATGDYEIQQDNIKSRRSTGMSLMPNGFEALGKDGLRDLISYLCADENRFRVVDLSKAFTADSTRGIFNSLESVNETLRFRKFGLVNVGGVPFDIVSPIRSRSGKNLIVLKGGNGFAKTLPQKVEAPVQAKANRIHFLGGVAGWGYPCCGDNNHQHEPAAKVTVTFDDGSTKVFELKNGEEFADYIGKYDVPKSKEAERLVRSGQVRWFTKNLGREGVIEKISFESYDNAVAPVFVAVTTELADKVEPEVETVAAKKPVHPNAIRTLIVGGGSSHNFRRWFGDADTATLEKDGLASVEYTEDIGSILDRLPELDVLYLSNNQPMKDPKLRKAIFDFVNSGKGLVLVHPALWYNFNDWPEYNAKLVGGGTHGHDRYQKFEVHIVNTDHPITKGVAPEFTLKDELYHFEPDANGSPIEILATANLPGSEKSFPNIWVTKYSKGRIACMALGHDAEAHDNPNYQKLLRNMVKWAAGK